MDTASTSDAVTFITYVQSLKRKIKQFEKQVEVSSVLRCALGVPGASLSSPLPSWKGGHRRPRRRHFRKLCRRSLGTSGFDSHSFLSFEIFYFSC